MNPTVEKFGYPATLVKQFEHWLVLVRPAQVTLGSLVLASRSSATAYAALPRGAFTEQADVVRAIERALQTFVQYDRINYLMLMMVDPHVHMHVIPRYSQPRRWNGIDFADEGWPGPPRLDRAVKLDAQKLPTLVKQIKSTFDN
jgi:diadenosine tetraphosphate (Ap4A) HIT family hydrolase